LLPLSFGASRTPFLLSVSETATEVKFPVQFLANSFSAANLAQFGFGESAYNTSIQGNYFTITAIPEASAWIAAVGLLGLLACSARRRRHT